jgi:glutathione synthase/RimK-type ligase-like ATP-grasp enzyme
VVPDRPRVALATAAGLGFTDPDEALALTALDQAGIEATMAVWDDPGVPWGDFDLVVVRSTWDYTARHGAFLEWAASVPRLANPFAVLAWNTDKHYLADLERAGVPVIETRWLEPGDPPTFFDRPFVVKPAVGAGSRDAQRYEPGETGAAAEHVARLHAAGTTAMVQPYLEEVERGGEQAVIFIGGHFSHGVRKEAMLGEARLGREERISARAPSDQALAIARYALSVLPFRSPLLYARIDLLEGDGGAPVVLEAELTEPSLFLSHDAQAPTRLADAVAVAVSG